MAFILSVVFVNQRLDHQRRASFKGLNPHNIKNPKLLKWWVRMFIYKETEDDERDRRQTISPGTTNALEIKNTKKGELHDNHEDFTVID